MTRANRRRIVIYPMALLVALTLTFLASQAKARDDKNLIGTLLNGGELMVKLGMYDKATENATRILKLEPDNLYAHLMLALIHQRSARYEESIREYEIALELTQIPEQRQYILLVMADVTRMKKDYEGARARLDRFRDSFGDRPDASMIRGRLLADIGDHATAVQWYRKAAGGTPPVKEVHAALVRSYLELGDRQKALEVLEAAAGNGIKIRGLWYEVAVLRRDLGDREGAIAALRSAMKESSKYIRRRLEKEKAAWGSLPAGLVKETATDEG